MTETYGPWRNYPAPRPLGSIEGIPTFNGELIRRRGPLAIMLLPDGRTVEVHLDSFVRARRNQKR